MSDSVELAYRRCEAVTRVQAANFYYGIRLLSPPRRRAMCAVYAFARRIDDIGDGALEPSRKRAELDREQIGVSQLFDRRPPAQGDFVAIALGDAAARFPLPEDAFSELIEGVRMDLDGVRYESFEELVTYCRRVAGTIGRMCLAIFGLREGAADMARASSLADDLGVALQLTNILRDVREDAHNGRVYLPAEDLRQFGVKESGEQQAPAVLAAIAVLPGGELEGLVHFEAARAREWFARGLDLTDLLDRRSAACLLAMAGIYRRLLERIDADPSRALRERMSLPTREKALVAVRGLAGLRP